MLARYCERGVVVLSFSVFGQAPAPPADQSPTAPHHAIPKSDIKVQVNEVIVPVTVTDEKGRFVSDLDQKDFRIFDEGKEQSIQFFTRERSQPVVVGFLIDLSNNSRLHWKNYSDAATELVLNLLPGDPKFSGYLIGYSNTADLLTDTTTDPEKIVDAFDCVERWFGRPWMEATRHTPLSETPTVLGLFAAFPAPLCQRFRGAR